VVLIGLVVALGFGGVRIRLGGTNGSQKNQTYKTTQDCFDNSPHKTSSLRALCGHSRGRHKLRKGIALEYFAAQTNAMYQ
jgi:hypothetical protein